jgi:hypothetical protein
MEDPSLVGSRDPVKHCSGSDLDFFRLQEHTIKNKI